MPRMTFLIELSFSMDQLGNELNKNNFEGSMGVFQQAFIQFDDATYFQCLPLI